MKEALGPQFKKNVAKLHVEEKREDKGGKVQEPRVRGCERNGE